jgi:phosphohistidine phosphatase
MYRLLLLRHAKAVPFGVGGDHERALTEGGREDARRMGDYLAREHLLPDFAAVSDARRTRETWELVSEGWRKPPVRFEPRIYEAPTDTLWSLLRRSPDDMRTLLCVGHNPGVAELAIELIGFGDRYAQARLRAKFPTCSLAILDINVDAWSQAAPGAARLDRFVTPAALGGVDD